MYYIFVQMMGLEPTFLLLFRDSFLDCCVYTIPPHLQFCTDDESRTRMTFTGRLILSQLCIPFHHIGNLIVTQVGLEPTPVKALLLRQLCLTPVAPLSHFVPLVGIEPTRLSAYVPKTYMCYQFHHKGSKLLYPWSASNRHVHS